MKYQDGLQAINSEEIGGVTPIPSQQQWDDNAAFQAWLQSGKEADERRAILVHLNQKELNSFTFRASIPGADIEALQREIRVWRWKGRAGLWGREAWRAAEQQLTLAEIEGDLI